MILIFGGAYQGKTEYAKSQFNIGKICSCADGKEPDFSADAISGIEGFVFECAGKGTDVCRYFKENQDKWKDKILIITDTSQGVVPVEEHVREAREMNGRLMLYLAGQAAEIHRVFCGIGKRIK